MLSLPRALLQSLVGELRSCKPHSVTKERNKKRDNISLHWEIFLKHSVLLFLRPFHINSKEKRCLVNLSEPGEIRGRGSWRFWDGRVHTATFKMDNQLEPTGGFLVAQQWRICLLCRSLRRRGFNPWVRKISWRRKWQPTPVFLLGESHGERSLVGYNP